jgi:2-polyprenyl-6-methoxyphenol hydroxylase-like FAD-dependent oxidoreductase
MTPYLGQGATNTIVDAMTLAEKLKSAQHGNEEERKQQSVTERVGDYENSMLKRGNAVIKPVRSARRLRVGKHTLASVVP